MNKNENFGCSLNFYNDYGSRQNINKITIIYLLEGTAQITVADDKYKMKKDDLILINYGQSFMWQQEADLLVCTIEIQKEMFGNNTVLDTDSFRCNSVTDKENSYKEIKRLISDLIVEYTEDSIEMTFKKKSLFFALLDILLNRYISGQNLISAVIPEDRYFAGIIEYINANYGRHLNLHEVAGAAFMTDSAFSRYFKKNVGINYSEYLNNVRLQHAAEDLLSSNKTFTEVALNNGFTDLAMFSKAFKKHYKATPSEYKKSASARDIKKQQEKKDTVTASYHNRLVKFVDERKREDEDDILKKYVPVNTCVFKKNERPWNIAINIGEANDLLMADMQRSVLELKNNLGFKYIRIVNIFGWNMRLRQDREYKRLNFDLLDNVLDFLVDNDLKPILEFGDKPRRLTLDIESIIPMDKKMPVFESIGEARWLVENFIGHVIEKYGINKVESWIFEFWYDKRDRNLSEAGYLEMFDMAYNVIKSYVPACRFGGCGLELGADVLSFLTLWSHSHIKPDFISLAAFPYTAEAYDNKTDCEKKIRSTDEHFIYNEIQKLKKRLADISMDNIPIMLTEWNLTMSDRNFYNESCAKAAQMLMNMTECLGEVQLGAYLFGTDLNSRYYDTSADFYGGVGLLTKNMLTKPSFYAIKFIGQLGSVLVQQGDEYIVTRNVENEFIILMFNAKKFNYNYYTRKENEIHVEDVHRIFSDDDAVELELELNGVSNGRYLIKTENLGENSGGFMSAWIDLGGAANLGKAEIEYLKRISIPRIRNRQEIADSGRLVISETLQAHDIRLIRVKKI